MEHLFNGLEDKYVKAYLNYQVGIATLLGADRDKAIKEQTLALLFEIELAKVYDKVAVRIFDSDE